MKIIRLSTFYVMFVVLLLGWIVPILFRQKISAIDFGGLVVFLLFGISAYVISEET